MDGTKQASTGTWRSQLELFLLRPSTLRYSTAAFQSLFAAIVYYLSSLEVNSCRTVCSLTYMDFDI